MCAKYAVKTVVCQDGERLPMLLDTDSGQPLFDVTVFTLCELRSRNLASSTIEQVLRALKVLFLFCDLQGISLDERLSQGRLLQLGEVEDLARRCRSSLDDLEAQVRRATIPYKSSNSTTVSLLGYRTRSVSASETEVGSAGMRLRYIAQYLKWLTERRLLNLSPQHLMFAALTEVKSLVVDAILARVPGDKGRNGLGKRTSLTQEAQERVWQVIGPESPENPWKGAHARARNELIVRWLLGLGLRRGELLGVDIRLINFRSNEVVVVRRADDKHDPRVIQPNAKTLDRVLPFNGDLAKRTQDYIINFRRKFPLAKKHPFLFVANGGRPLGIRALNKIFEALRERCPDLPDDVMPHVLRHTWNDNFSIAMDDSGTAPENEQKMRSRLMGWKPTSKTAETYNRRATERRARKASLEMQEKMVKRTK